jgi:magnesium-transporting ATPase (P-type)
VPSPAALLGVAQAAPHLTAAKSFLGAGGNGTPNGSKPRGKAHSASEDPSVDMSEDGGAGGAAPGAGCRRTDAGALVHSAHAKTNGSAASSPRRPSAANGDGSGAGSGAGGGGAGAAPVERVANVNVANVAFGDNRIATSKYSALSFVPRCLFEQFRRVANVYFLLTAILMVVGTYAPTVFESPLLPFSTIGPLLLVLSISMIKEGIEDLKRHRSDREINNRLVGVVGPGGSVTQVRWQEVRVGQVIRVENKHEVPADLVLLQTSERQGMCYVETSNIDGETNLKIKEAVPDVARTATEASVGALTGTIHYEQPNDSIHTFEGRLCLAGVEAVSVGVNNLVLRGCTLRNTRWLLGLVVFSGAETKVMKKSAGGRSKMSRVERIVNKCIGLILATQFLLCMVSTILQRSWAADNEGSDYSRSYVMPTWISLWLTFFILYNNFIPISLYVTIEMVNFAQALLVDKDAAMYDPTTGALLGGVSPYTARVLWR